MQFFGQLDARRVEDRGVHVDAADKIIRHLDVLGEELRNATGAATVAYEAAHFFLCYP